jgi:hypothetical protein
VTKSIFRGKVHLCKLVISGLARPTSNTVSERAGQVPLEVVQMSSTLVGPEIFSHRRHLASSLNHHTRFSSSRALRHETCTISLVRVGEHSQLPLVCGSPECCENLALSVSRSPLPSPDLLPLLARFPLSDACALHTPGTSFDGDLSTNNPSYTSRLRTVYGNSVLATAQQVSIRYRAPSHTPLYGELALNLISWRGTPSFEDWKFASHFLPCYAAYNTS